MKKVILFALSAITLGAVTSCDNLLNDNRYPLTSIVNNPSYWGNTANCDLQVNRYLNELNPGYGSGGGQDSWFYFKTLNDDQVGSNFAQWNYTSVPGTNGSWTYSQVRGANYIIEGVRSAQSTLGPSAYRNYEGIGRFIRAVAYYKLVRTFGDVVWESDVVDPSDDAILYGPRTKRDIVMDSVFADLQYAVANINTASSQVYYCQDLVKCYLSEIGLYEGTFCKYRTKAENGYDPDQDRAKKYLELSAKYSQELMNSYGFGETIEDYHAIYNSTRTGGESTVEGFEGEKITAFGECPEIIWGRYYDPTNGRHSLVSFTCSSTTTSGMSLDGFKAFLFLDGKPASTTSYDNTLVGEPTTFGDAKALSIQKLLDVRDKRLSVITDPYVYFTGMTWTRVGSTGMTSSSGFGIAKYDNVLLPLGARNMSANNYTCAPIYWTSYIYCNFAEAKAELGTLTDGDLNNTLNKLYKRAGLPTQTVGGLSAINDPANNMGVSSLIWEVRRCRRCELMFDNWIRFWDLVRWHQLDKLDSTKYPDILRGAYVANAPVDVPAANIDADGFYKNYSNQRTFNARYYLDPIPSGQLDLNPQLGQNPGW